MTVNLLVNIFLITFSVVAIGEEVGCENYDVEIVEKFEYTDFPAGRVLYLGGQENTFTLKDFLDPQWLETERTVCEEKITNRTQCWGEPFEIILYNNGLMVEVGPSIEVYRLTNDFPKTPRGIVPGMSREQVVSVLGRPRRETENTLEYDFSKDPVYARDAGATLYFIDRKLTLIGFLRWTGMCYEH